MRTIELLTQRRSCKTLSAPAPNQQQIEQILQAALHVPDHGRLKPYRFVVIKNKGLVEFSELLQNAVTELKLGDSHLEKARNMVHRAPMVIAVIAKLNPSIKRIPVWEQMITAGCAAYSIQLAANDLGFDNVWVSGNWTEGNDLREAFNCQEEDKIIGFILLGSNSEKPVHAKEPIELAPFISYLD